MSEYIKEIRRKIGHEKLLAPGTSAILVNADRQVLLMLRSETNEWGLIGGFMDIGETVIESLEREVREETGLEIHEPRIFGIYSGPEFDSKHANGDETASVTLAFLVERFSGELRGRAESKRLRFVSLDDLPEPMNATSVRLLKEYREYREERREIPTIL